MTAFGNPAAANIITLMVDSAVYSDRVVAYLTVTDIVSSKGAGYAQ